MERPSASAGALVENRFEQVTAYADNALATTNAAIEAMAALVGGLAETTIEPLEIPSVDVPPVDFSNRPSLGALTIPSPSATLPTAPVLTNISKFSELSLSPSGLVCPVLNMPPVPALSNVSQPGAPAVPAEITMPAMPQITLPNPPKFDDIIIPQIPDVSFPEFQYDMPSFALDSPAPFVWGDPVPYDEAIWAPLFARVMADIEHGGTGIDPDIEEELYQRFKDKVLVENERMYDEANTYFAGRGWTMPPGALAGRLNEINMQVARNDAMAAREIAINQMDLALKNTQFMCELGSKLEASARDFYVKQTNLAFEAAKAVAENSIAIYNAKAQEVSLSIELFKGQAMIYETQLKGVLAKVEVFKAQVEGAAVSAQARQALVSVYNAQLGSVDAMIRLYVAQMEGAKLQADVEVSKLGLYESQVKAYIAQLDMDKTRMSIYEAQVNAEGMRATIYKAQVEAYASEADVAIKQYEAQIKSITSQIEMNRAVTEQYKAQVEAYDAEIKAGASLASAMIEGFRAEAMAYEAETSAQAANYNVQIENIKAQIAAIEMQTRVQVANLEAVSRNYVALQELRIKGTEGVMSVGAQLTASAMNAVNASASYGFSSSEGWNWGDSTSYSESHNYEEL